MSATERDRLASWFERHPQRLEWELAQFAERGLPARAVRSDDSASIETELTFRGKPVPIRVEFPYDYPDDAPTVYGPPGLLDRHQNPFDGNFCLFEDADRDWWPQADAAHLVAEDLRWLFEDMERGVAAVHGGEADMPEPITGHLRFGTGVVVVPDPYFARDLPAAEGNMTLVGRPGLLYLDHAARLGSPDPDLRERYFDATPEEDGYWVALDPTPSPQVLGNPDELIRVVRAAAPDAFKRLGYRLRNNKALASAEGWLGISFMEEGPTRDETRRNWVFTRVTRRRDGLHRSSRLLRAQALTLGERRRRTPELVGLEHARVLVIGAGSLGSPVAVELTKAGIGHLDIADNDVLDVNNSVRHVLSPRRAGLQKAQSTASVAADLNPFVTVEGHELQVGGGGYAARELAALVEQATVVVDTTGSSAVARILQRHCSDTGRTLVVAGLSAGSWGGEVAVFTPGNACFECFVLAQRDKAVPEPEAAPPGPGVTPVGCSHPAFSGAGFDATELAGLTARTVVQATDASSYPPLDFDWVVVNFRGTSHWQSGRLDKHPDCARCNPPDSASSR